jgi:hypothetical protein
MDHVVYLDASAHELKNLLSGKKTMIIRGAAGRKLPHGRVNKGDTLYFLDSNGEGFVRAQARVKNVLNSEALTKEESMRLAESHQSRLQLTEKQLKRWGGKRYLVLIEVEGVKQTDAFQVNKRNFGNMDDWLSVDNIKDVKL